MTKKFEKSVQSKLQKKRKIKHQYGNYRKKLELRTIKKWEKIKEKRIAPKQVKVKEISKQQTIKTSREATDSQQEPQLMILNETNITDNIKTRNKNKNRTYSAVVKGITNKDTNETVISFQKVKANLVRDDGSQSYITSPPVLSCDTSVCNTHQIRQSLLRSLLVVSSQDCELLCVLEDLQNESHVNDNCDSSDESRIRGYFCSDTIFNLSKGCYLQMKSKF